MLRCIFLSFLLFFFITDSAVSQDYNSKKGFIVTTGNDTVYGDFKDHLSYKTGFSFRPADSNIYNEYNPNNVESFLIDGKNHYQSCEVNVDSIKTEKYFLLLLVNGPMSLFYCENEFYLIKKAGIFYKIEKKEDVLKQVEYPEAQAYTRTIVIPDTRYIGIIKTLVKEAPPVYNKTDFIQYDSKSLVRIVNQYNNYVDPDYQIFQQNESVKIRVKAGIRFTYLVNDMVNFPKDGRYVNDNFEKKVGFSCGLVFRFSRNNKVSFQPEVILTKRKASLYRENEYGDPEDLRIDLTYLELPATFNYTFPTSKISPYLMGGGLIGFKVSDKSVIKTIYTTVTDMEILEFGFRLGTGIVVKKGRDPFLSIGYIFEKNLTNVHALHMRYHQIANQLSTVVYF
jgi:hypothetical protein